MDLIFDFNQNKGFLSGIMTNYQIRELASESDLIGVRFKSEKFGFLSKIPLCETRNLRVELNEIFPTKILPSLNQLSDFKQTADRITFLENLIGILYKLNFQTQDPMVLSVAQDIRSLHGIVNVGDLVKSQHISLRQLERRFKSYIGVTLKEFAKMVRFKNAKKSITNSKATSLLEIAFYTGFFDHSHMTNEFKRISGEPPSSFR